MDGGAGTAKTAQLTLKNGVQIYHLTSAAKIIRKTIWLNTSISRVPFTSY